MKIKRLILNTTFILIAAVLVFAPFSSVFADVDNSGTYVPGTDNKDYPTSGPPPDDSGNWFMGANGYWMSTSDNQGPSVPVNITTDQKGGKETQAQQTLNPSSVTSTSTGTVPKGDYRSITSNILGCSVGQLLASVISTGITSALNGLSNLLGVWTGAPVHDAQTNGTLGFMSATSHGFQIFGVYVGVSLDSIAYCIVNSILEYIANATIAWANSGFNGSPAFVQNPERFFQGLADQQESEFINALAYNTAINGRSLNVCQTFRTGVAIDLARNYGATGNRTAGAIGYAPQGSCGLTPDQLAVQRNRGLAKDVFKYGYDTVLNPNNNRVDVAMSAARFASQMVLQKAASVSQQLNWGNGFRSPMTCSDPRDSNSCSITVPGTLINQSLQNTVNIGQNRLLNATKFDQVVSSIVNNLIRIGLNKLLSPIGLGVPAGANFVNQSPYSQTTTSRQPASLNPPANSSAHSVADKPSGV